MVEKTTTLSRIVIVLIIINSVTSLQQSQQQQQDNNNNQQECPKGYWPFDSPCSGYGTCVNGSCVCFSGFVPENDFVPSLVIVRNGTITYTKLTCLTQDLSRKILAGIQAVVSFIGFCIALHRLYLAWPFKSLPFASPRTVVLLISLMHVTVCIYGILALCGYWTTTSPAMAVIFILHTIFVAIATPALSLSVIQLNYTIINKNNHRFTTVKIIYVIGSIIYAIAIITVVFVCTFVESLVWREICSHIVGAIYSLLLFFWGVCGFFHVVLIDNTALKHSSEKSRAKAFRYSTYTSATACIVMGFIGLLAAVIPHWYGHIYLSIHIVGALTNIQWMISLKTTSGGSSTKGSSQGSKKSSKASSRTKETEKVSTLVD